MIVFLSMESSFSNSVSRKAFPPIVMLPLKSIFASIVKFAYWNRFVEWGYFFTLTNGITMNNRCFVTEFEKLDSMLRKTIRFPSSMNNMYTWPWVRDHQFFTVAKIVSSNVWKNCSCTSVKSNCTTKTLFPRFAPNTHIYLYASTVHMYCIYPAILNRK
jgi:hypothetical protein